jgi:crotonobetainyl-CoA:carnitine CoA-transferase CaiB-like acyl-CoA transferase
MQFGENRMVFPMVLEGIRVLDFSRVVSGPYCSTQLADMGAEVIKVEQPGGWDDRQLGPFAANGQSITYSLMGTRDKKGITLDMRSPKGKEIFKELVKVSDIVLENFSPGGREIMGLSYPSLKEINPAIIFVSISGFGQTGPNSHRLSFDPAAQAASGAMAYTGFPGGPPTRAQVGYVDLGAGLHAALGAMYALYHRAMTGKGQAVDVSLFDVAVGFTGGLGGPAEYKLNKVLRPQIGNHSYHNFSNSFQTKDGWIVISVISEGLWKRFVKTIDMDDLARDARFQSDESRYQNRELFEPAIAEWMAQRTTAEVEQLMEQARVPCGRVNTVADLLDDPQVKAREMLVDVDYPGIGKVPVPGVVVKLSETPGRIKSRGPTVGEHNEEVYCGLLGLTPEELSSLRDEGVI